MSALDAPIPRVDTACEAIGTRHGSGEGPGGLQLLGGAEKTLCSRPKVATANSGTVQNEAFPRPERRVS